MAKINFTTERVSIFQCPDHKKQDFQWDSGTQGLGQCVSKTSNAYVFQARLNGKTLRLVIGKTSTWRLSDARNEAKRLQVMVDQGIDPRKAKADALAADQASRDNQKRIDAKRTLLARTAWDVYVTARSPKWGRQHRADHAIASNEGGTDCKIGHRKSKPAPLAPLLKMPLNDITAQVVQHWLAKECETRSTSAHNCYRKFRTFINWCASQDEYKAIIHADCCTHVNVKENVPKKKTKEGDSLQVEQLAPWFAAVRAISNPVLSAYFQGLLITGARRNELATLRWTDVDFQWNKMDISDKVEGMRTIPLTPHLSGLLSSLPRDNEWVFSSAGAASGHIESPTKAHQKALSAAKLPHVSIHGLRRTFGTLAEWVDAPTGIVAQIMGHKPSATAEKSYRRRSIDFLRKWHVKIEDWILEQAKNEANLP